MAKRVNKAKEAELEIVDDIFMVEKNSKKLIGLNPNIEESTENLVIPEGIEIIGPAAFVSKNKFQYSDIKSVKLPNSLMAAGLCANVFREVYQCLIWMLMTALR